MEWEDDDLDLIEYLWDYNLTCLSMESTSTNTLTTRTEEPFQEIEAGIFAMIIINALNSADKESMRLTLSSVCEIDLTVTYSNYVKSLTSDLNASNQETFSSLPPMSGLDSFIDYWMKVHETTPDCVMTLKTPVRLCHRTKKGECAYIFGVELVGTMLAWIDTPYPLTFQSNHF
eukprot:gene15172-16940_t